MNNTSEQWMAHYQQGDTEALEHLYCQFRSPLYCFIFRYTRDEHFSIDIVQDTFVKLQMNKGKYDPRKGTVKSFLFQIAYRLMITKLNRRRKWRSLLPFLTTPIDTSLSREDTLTVQEAVTRLPALHRAVILLFYYHDMTQQDISTILNIPVGTVKSRLHKAIELLKQDLEVQDEEQQPYG